MLSDHRLLARTSKEQMSKISTGRKMVRGLDGRSSEARRYRDLCKALVADLGREPSGIEMTLIKQCAVALVASEALHARAITGQATAPELRELGRLANAAMRATIALGLQRKGSIRHGLDLDQYLDDRKGHDA